MDRSKASLIVRTYATYALGIVTGAMVEEYALFKFILMGLPAEHWAHVHSKFGALHPYTIIPLASTGTLALFVTIALEREFRSRRAMWSSMAAALGVAIGLLTIAVMFPMNEAIAEVARSGVPDTWTDLRDRWTTLQGARALLASLAFFGLAVAAQTTRGRLATGATRDLLS